MSDPDDSLGTSLTRYGPAAALGLVALAFVLRAPGLFEWWLNPDEGIYFAAITQERFADFWAEAKATAHPPLYFLILRGIAWLTTDFAWLRSVALVSGCAAVYVFVLVGREMGGAGARGWLTGLLSGLLLAVAPRAIILSQVIRPYMLLDLLLAGALYVLLRYLRLPSTRLLLVYAACTSLAVILHYSSALALGVFGAAVLSDGVRRGFDRPEWRRLLLTQSLPALTLGAMYAWHLRDLMGSGMADYALEGWLASYMIGEPLDMWLSLVGFHSTLAGERLAAPAALLTLVGVGWAAWDGSWTTAVLVASGVVIAVVGALLQLYPFGPTRHTSWLIVFVAPALAWTVVSMLTSGPRVRVPSLALLAAGVVGAGPLSTVLDSERRPREISEHVLLRTHVAAMAEVLNPQAGPELVLMSTETYWLLMPLFAHERQAADASRDGLMIRFRWGDRTVVVIPSRDFAALPEQRDQPNHLYTAALRASEDFGIEWPQAGDPVLVLAGGWRSQGMEDLAELSRRVGSLGTTTYVPGLIALSLDLEAYGRALGEPSG